MNRIIIMGRLTADPETRTTQTGVSVVTFTTAVDRDYTPKGQEKQTDFIPCVAWAQTGEFVSRYFRKGDMIAVEGQLRSRSYEDKTGAKRIAWEVNVDRAHFCGGRHEAAPDAEGNPLSLKVEPDNNDAFADVWDEDLPL